MNINRKTFYAEIKSLFPNGYSGRVGQRRLAGLDNIMDEFDRRGDVDRDELAYILATTFHETAFTMQPVKEYGSASYLKKKKYWPYIGMGYVQLTWEANYKKAGDKLGIDLVGNPELAMDPKYAVQILFDGMLEGWFTGKKLRDYIDGVEESDAEDLREFASARHIINGSDKAQKIAEYALKIDRALYKATVVNPSPLVSSRTVQGAAVTGGVASVNLVSQVQDVVSAVQDHQDAFTSGQVVGIIIGAIAVLGALYTLYARWDDAGRPKFWQ